MLLWQNNCILIWFDVRFWNEWMFVSNLKWCWSTWLIVKTSVMRTYDSLLNQLLQAIQRCDGGVAARRPGHSQCVWEPLWFTVTGCLQVRNCLEKGNKCQGARKKRTDCQGIIPLHSANSCHFLVVTVYTQTVPKCGAAERRITSPLPPSCFHFISRFCGNREKVPRDHYSIVVIVALY